MASSRASSHADSPLRRRVALISRALLGLALLPTTGVAQRELPWLVHGTLLLDQPGATESWAISSQTSGHNVRAQAGGAVGGVWLWGGVSAGSRPLNFDDNALAAGIAWPFAELGVVQAALTGHMTLGLGHDRPAGWTITANMPIAFRYGIWSLTTNMAATLEGDAAYFPHNAAARGLAISTRLGAGLGVDVLGATVRVEGRHDASFVRHVYGDLRSRFPALSIGATIGTTWPTGFVNIGLDAGVWRRVSLGKVDWAPVIQITITPSWLHE